MANIVQYEAKDGQNVELTFETIKKYLVTGRPELVTNQEMIFFIGICKARGLNPFAKDCYLIKYTEKDPAAIITSIDFFRSRARAQRDCKGWEAGIIVEDDQTGQIRYSKGLIRKNENLLGGYFKAKPAGWDYEFNLEVNLDGYIKKTREGNITKFWQKENQPTMIRKVAESQGLRELWPDEFAKVYVEEEIDRSEMMDITPKKGLIPDKPAAQNAGEDPYKVQDTPQDAPGSTQEEGEGETSQDFPCPHCDFNAVSERGLKKHITQTHPLQSEGAKKHFGTDSDDIHISGETLASEEEPDNLAPYTLTEDNYLRACSEYTDELGLPVFNKIMMSTPFFAKHPKDVGPDQWQDFLNACSRKLDEVNA